MAADLKLILDPGDHALVFIDGEPAAVAIALPNINELIDGPRRQALSASACRSCSIASR